MSKAWTLAPASSLTSDLNWVLLGPTSSLTASVITCNIEPCNFSDDEYVQSVRTVVERDPSSQWLNLATIDCKGGRWKIVKIVPILNTGDPYIQAFQVRDGWAVVITAIFPDHDFLAMTQELCSWLRHSKFFKSPFEVLGEDDRKKWCASTHSKTQQYRERPDHFPNGWDPGSTEWEMWRIQAIRDRRD